MTAVHSILTLIAAPRSGALQSDIVSAVLQDLAEEKVALRGPEWLAPEEACDIAFMAAPPPAIRQRLSVILAGLPIDFHIQPATNRRKRLIVCDMDATILEGETLDDLSQESPNKAEIDELTRKAVAGEVDFAQSLRLRASLLAGTPESAFDAAYRKSRISAGAKTLIRTMRAHGAKAALVSGGFRYFTSRVAATIGFDIDRSNDVGFTGGRLNGELLPPILDPVGKRMILQELAAANGGIAASMAVGDGTNDIPMLAHAGLGVAYRAKPRVRAAIDCRIDHGDLTALLYLQGYHKSAFVED